MSSNCYYFIHFQLSQYNFIISQFIFFVKTFISLKKSKKTQLFLDFFAIIRFIGRMAQKPFTIYRLYLMQNAFLKNLLTFEYSTANKFS